jgi:hypothetical protein
LRLHSRDGASLSLAPLAYEFPEMVPQSSDDWDANWLVVRGEVVLADGRSWRFTHPCLATWDVAKLAAFLEDIGAGRLSPGDPESDEFQLEFTENLVAFELAELSADHVEIEVTLASEARPPWIEDIHEGYVLSLRSTLAELTQAVESLHRHLERFPHRAPD